jgi:quercetin dioxygenase-like cupin family protein
MRVPDPGSRVMLGLMLLILSTLVGQTAVTATDPLRADVWSSASWDVQSGYRVLEASRAGVLHLVAHSIPAQAATPAADMLPPGVSAQPLAFGSVPSLPSPADLVLVRFTLQPGAVLPSDPTDPSLGLLYVESGTLTVQLAAPLQITRAATVAMFATPNAAIPGPELVAAGATATLRPGDSAVGPPHVGGNVRNTGRSPAVLLLASIAPSEMGTLAATPAAEPTR